MQAITSTKDLDFILEKNLVMFRCPEPGFKEELKGQYLKDWVEQLGIQELANAISRREFYYIADQEGRNTLIIKQFETDEEMYEWIDNLDIPALEKEIINQYGRCVGFLDKENRQFLITRKPDQS